jgi:hypothetical protein
MGYKGSNDRTQDRVKAAQNNEDIKWPLREARKAELDKRDKEEVT